jgi:glycosyltransferase involved in cell wall biosynthesis
VRFAFISTMQGWPWGGSEELWSQSAARLKRAGHEVRASVEYWPSPSEKVTALKRQGVEMDFHFSFQVPRARRIWNKLSRRSRRANDRLKRFNPDLVIISQGHNSGGFAWAKVCREAAIPYVIIVQCNTEFAWFDEQEIGEAAASYTAARKVFCVSRHNLDLLRIQLGERLPNGEVVSNPYNVSRGASPPWPDENGGLHLSCVARMDLAAKGQDILLQIMARPEWRERRVELNFFGTGAHAPAVRRIAEMLEVKNVHFHGHVNDIRAIWEKNHLLVLPSRYEGLPLALAEAMICGRPAVVTDAGGNAELCVDGQTGFVAPAATVSCFAQTLERAWERRAEWRQLGQAARTYAESRIPVDPVAVFCEQLTACAGEASRAETVTEQLQHRLAK